MLVKFLSFVATIFGTARYKAIFLSCLAVVLSITGVTAVAVFKDGAQSKSAASTVGKQNDDSPQQDGTPQLGGINKQQSTKDVDQTEAQAPNSANNQSSGTTTPSSSESNTPANEIVLSNDKFMIAAGNTSDAITASLTDKSSVTWAVAPASDTDTGVRAVIAQNNTATLSFQLQANQSLQPGTTVRLNLTAHDSSRNLNLTKQITAVIQ